MERTNYSGSVSVRRRPVFLVTEEITRVMLMLLSHARFGEERRLAQVIPPSETDAGDVEQQEDCKREIGPTRRGNGGGEPARDKIAAACADSADEADRRRGFESRFFERKRAVS